MAATTHYPPRFKEKQFHCMHCGVYAAQRWTTALWRLYDSGGLDRLPDFDFCNCSHCLQQSAWFQQKMVVPTASFQPPPHEDMPADCRPDYEEARQIFTASPRAAAALLRLAIQKLMPFLGEAGKNINEDIAGLVAKGLPTEVQQALDYCRVVGNNAVHPGELNLQDSPEIASQLFAMLNFIVEDRIARPKQIAALYSALPETARHAISRRDAKTGGIG